MKRLIIIAVFLFPGTLAWAQAEATYWYFGNLAGLKFSSAGVVPLSQSAMAIDEGCATISNSEGRLLFYTKGTTVYNRLNIKMLNGDGLFGDISSTQNAIIVPEPHNDSIYYIFTVDATGGSKGLNYSIVNIHGDRGLGEVTNKNIHLADSVYEKISAVQNCNKRDVWVAVRQFNSDIYQVFSVTRSGITGPLLSHTGVQVGGITSNAIGAMKFSNDGQKLAAAHGYGNDFVELLDFNNVTGNLSNARVFRSDTTSPSGTHGGVYGLEFSPGNNFLYTSSYDPGVGNSYLFQFNVSGNSTSAIINSKKLIAILPEEIMAALQIGIDKKIYASTWGSYFLSVINDPDIPDTGCHFMHSFLRAGINNSQHCQGGLPSFIQSYFNTAFNAFDFSRSGRCDDKTVHFTLNKTLGIDSLKWNFGDNTSSNTISPVHTFPAGGYFEVSLIVFKHDCSGENDSITHKIWVAPASNLFGPDTSVCLHSSVKLGFTVQGADYLWSTGSVSDSIFTDTSGLYWVQIYQFGCNLSDSLNLTITKPPVLNLGIDTAICNGESVILSGGNDGATYLWSTRDTSQTIRVTSKGTYSVTVTHNSCKATSAINVETGACDLQIPNAFSPNGDGLNDEFGVLNKFGIKSLDLRIYDRWGKLLFQTSDITKRWTGKYNGSVLNAGAYIWTISYINSANHPVKDKGTVMLLR